MTRERMGVNEVRCNEKMSKSSAGVAVNASESVECIQLFVSSRFLVVFLRSFRSAAVISYTVQRNSVLSPCIHCIFYVVIF